jgi:hypothetical protein
VVWQDNSVGTGKVSNNLVVAHKAVYEGDPRAKLALFHELDGKVPSFPRLAHNGQPVALDLSRFQRVKRSNKIFETLERADDPEEEKVDALSRRLADWLYEGRRRASRSEVIERP